MAARFRVKEPTRIGSRDASRSEMSIPRVLAFSPSPAARPPSPVYPANTCSIAIANRLQLSCSATICFRPVGVSL